MRRRSRAWPLAVVAVIALAVFVALTVVVTTNPSLALDSRAFRIVNDVRAPWLDHAARVVTALGLIAIVGPVLLLAAGLLTRRRHHARATALATGAALTWISVWIVKTAVHRARPPAPLVHTSGQSYPSAHAANSVGWLALATALTVAIPTRRGRITMVAAGALLAALVGLSRIYLRAHYASDVLAGEALAVAMYALAAIGSLPGKHPNIQPSAPKRQPPAHQRRPHDARNAREQPTFAARTLSNGSARDTFLVGAVLSFPGASYIAGMGLLSKQKIGTAATVIAVLAFNAIILLLLELPLLGYAMRPEWTTATVQRFSDWLARRGGRVALIGAAKIGFLLIGRGVINF